MRATDYNLWIAYKEGKINIDSLNEKGISNIRACEFAMNLLLPDNILMDELKSQIESPSILSNYYYLEQLAIKYEVPTKVFQIKVRDLRKRLLTDKTKTKRLLKNGG